MGLVNVRELVDVKMNETAVTVKRTAVGRPNELARTMAPDPLIHQELPYDPTYFVYNR